MKTVKVKVLDEVTADQLEQMIQKHFDAGYIIQDSQVEWYQSKIMGVYVFVKEADS